MSSPPGADHPRPPVARVSAVGRLRLDVRHGRNLDLYIAVAVAVVIAVLGVAGAVDPKVLAAATLAVLALAGGVAWLLPEGTFR